VSIQAWRRSRLAAGDPGAAVKVLLAIASFTIYACAVLALHQHRTAMFVPEREAFAAAVSTAVFGAPLGTMYSGIMVRIRDPNTPLETALNQTIGGEVAPGVVIPEGGKDGNGIGYLVLTTGAMFIFGASTAAPILAMLALMAVSGAALLWRFGARAAVVILLYFVALTLLLFSPAVWEPRVASEVPIGGIRYFCVVGTLPAFHLAAEFLDVGDPRRGSSWRRVSTLFVQTAILVLAVLTRTSNAGLVAALALLWLYRLLSRRQNSSGVPRHLASGAFVAVTAGALFGLVVLLLPPQSFSEGRITGMAWHRAFISLGLNPSWPFGNLREIYNCDYAEVPGLRLDPGILDANGGCIWIHYAHAHGIQAYPVQPAPIEAAEREAFFNVARLYPRQVWETYFHYKSSMLAAEVENAIHPKFSLAKYSLLLRGLFIAAFAVLLAFVVIPTAAPDPDPVRSLPFTRIALIFGLSAFPGYYIAWPGTSQTFDLKLYTLLVFGGLLNAFAEWIKRGLPVQTHRGVVPVSTVEPQCDSRNDTLGGDLRGI
jgi:hypothetical protein